MSKELAMQDPFMGKLDLRAHLDTLTRRIRGMAYRYTGNDTVAEDLTQEILLRLHKNIATYRIGIGSLQNWAMRVGRNLIIDRYRANTRKPEVPLSIEAEQNTAHHGSLNPFDRLLQRETRAMVEKALQILPFGLEEAVRLRDLDGMTYQEISDRLRVPEGTVKSRINRGRKQLARLLAPHMNAFSF